MKKLLTIFALMLMAFTANAQEYNKTMFYDDNKSVQIVSDNTGVHFYIKNNSVVERVFHAKTMASAMEGTVFRFYPETRDDKDHLLFLTGSETNAVSLAEKQQDEFTFIFTYITNDHKKIRNNNTNLLQLREQFNFQTDIDLDKYYCNPWVTCGKTEVFVFPDGRLSFKIYDISIKAAKNKKIKIDLYFENLDNNIWDFDNIKKEFVVENTIENYGYHIVHGKLNQLSNFNNKRTRFCVHPEFSYYADDGAEYSIGVGENSYFTVYYNDFWRMAE